MTERTVVLTVREKKVAGFHIFTAILNLLFSLQFSRRKYLSACLFFLAVAEKKVAGFHNSYHIIETACVLTAVEMKVLIIRIGR